MERPTEQEEREMQQVLLDMYRLQDAFEAEAIEEELMQLFTHVAQGVD